MRETDIVHPCGHSSNHRKPPRRYNHHCHRRRTAVVCLGSALYDGNGHSSQELHRRVVLVARLCRSLHSSVLVLSGGDSHDGITDADTMQVLLSEEKDLPTDICVLLERESNNTFENAINVRSLLMSSEDVDIVDAVVVATSCYHKPRTLVTFDHVFSAHGDPCIHVVGTVPPTVRGDSYNIDTSIPFLNDEAEALNLYLLHVRKETMLLQSQYVLNIARYADRHWTAKAHSSSNISKTAQDFHSRLTTRRELIFIRHGHSKFNEAIDLGHLPTHPVSDPPLSSLGFDQATQLGSFFALDAAAMDLWSRVNEIVVSPFTRTLETASVALTSASRPPESSILVSALHCERSRFACDCGTPAALLALEFPELFDFFIDTEDSRNVDHYTERTNTSTCTAGLAVGALGHDVWWRCSHTTPPSHEPAEELQLRVEAFRQWLRGGKRRAGITAVFGHGNFLLRLLGGERLKNCEVRRLDLPPLMMLNNDECTWCVQGVECQIHGEAAWLQAESLFIPSGPLKVVDSN